MKQVRCFSLVLVVLFVAACSKEADRIPGAGVPPVSSQNTIDKTAMLKLVNEVRVKGCNCGSTYMPPVGTLVWNDKLENAALAHTLDMFSGNFFDHTGSNGSSPNERVSAAGYQWMATGENIATGYTSEQAVMNAWLASEGHCKNIMYANFKDFGAARVGNLWTQEFGLSK